jgi:hypothetical protein
MKTLIQQRELEKQKKIAEQFKIGDRIKDLEDEDCYYEGVVTQLNPLKYIVDKFVWHGKEWEDVVIGKEIELEWYYIEKA